jgi:hypothetical protein
MIADTNLDTVCLHSDDIRNFKDILNSVYDIKLMEMTKVATGLYKIRFHADDQWHTVTYSMYNRLIDTKGE